MRELNRSAIIVIPNQPLLDAPGLTCQLARIQATHFNRSFHRGTTCRYGNPGEP
jgi:hypothetical protein